MSIAKGMISMLDCAAAFNQPIGGWNVSNVTVMWHVFRNAAASNQPISDWDTSNVKNRKKMLMNCEFSPSHKPPSGGCSIS